MLKENEVLEEFFEDKKIIQNINLYRFTSDSILLSKFARAKSKDIVADFCSGSGVVGFHFLCLNPNILSLTLFEMQHSLADMSRRTAELNGFDCEVVNCKLQEIPKSYDDKFSLILCNPPFESGGFENADPKKAPCRKELALTLEELTNSAKRCLKFGGRFVLCHRADRSAEVIAALHEAGLEVKQMQFVSGKRGREPYLVLLSAKKGAKQGVKVLSEKVNQGD